MPSYGNDSSPNHPDWGTSLDFIIESVREFIALGVLTISESGCRITRKRPAANPHSRSTQLFRQWLTYIPHVARLLVIFIRSPRMKQFSLLLVLICTILEWRMSTGHQEEKYFKHKEER